VNRNASHTKRSALTNDEPAHPAATAPTEVIEILAGAVFARFLSTIAKSSEASGIEEKP